MRYARQIRRVVLAGVALSCACQVFAADLTGDMQVDALKEMALAVNAGDARRYARVYAEDAVIYIYGGDKLVGRRAIERYELELLRQFPGTRFGLYEIWLGGVETAVYYGVNGRTADGKPMGHEGLLFYEFNASGLIEEEHRYNDSLTPMAQLGMLGSAPARGLPTLPLKPIVYLGDEARNIAVAKSSLAAIESKSEAAFFADLADGAIVDELTLPQIFAGKQNVKSWFETWVETAPDATFQVLTIFGIDRFVFVEGIARGALKRSIGPLSPSKNQFSVHRAAVFEIEAGKIVHLSFFMNGKELAETSGQWPLQAGK